MHYQHKITLFPKINITARLYQLNFYHSRDCGINGYTALIKATTSLKYTSWHRSDARAHIFL